MDPSIATITMNGCPVTFASYDDRVMMLDRALHEHRGLRIGYANAHTVVTAERDPAFRAALQSFQIVFADGVGVFAGASILARNAMRLQRQQNATDFNQRVLEYAEARRLKIFLLASTADVLDSCVHRIASEYPNILVTGVHHGYINRNDAVPAKLINAAAPDVLFVGMGHPNQEIWVQMHASNLRVPLIITVGGFFNFFSGAQLRAPVVFRRLHFEWMFRLISEPKRLWRRYILGIPQFVYLLLRGNK